MPDMTQIVPTFTSGQVLYSASPELLLSAPDSFSYNYTFATPYLHTQKAL